MNELELLGYRQIEIVRVEKRGEKTSRGNWSGSLRKLDRQRPIKEEKGSRRQTKRVRDEDQHQGRA